MPVDSHTIDRIVAGVLNQLAADGSAAPVGVAAETQRRRGDAAFSREASPSASGERGSAIIVDPVITAESLIQQWDGEASVIVSERAIVTPSAWDVAKERGITITRQSPRATPRGYATSGNQPAKLTPTHRENTHGAQPVDLARLLIVVRNTDALSRLCDDLQGRWRRELLGCPDEAASMATSAICRGESSTVVIVAEQTHRAACLANRNDRVKAVAVREAADVPAAHRQLQANVWCLDPTGRSWFELRNLLRSIVGQEAQR